MNPCGLLPLDSRMVDSKRLRQLKGDKAAHVRKTIGFSDTHIIFNSSLDDAGLVFEIPDL